MRVALFGGSFDPPHIGHQLACLYVLETHAVDEVWMLPCAQHPFAKQLAPFAHRAAMCERAGASLSRVRVCTIEGELVGPSYTLHTVRALAERYPQHEFLLVIGADLLHEREHWHGAAELFTRVRFIVLGRRADEKSAAARPSPAHEKPPGETAPIRPRDIRHAQALDLPPVSSTAVRAALASGQTPTGWLAASVLTYIQEQALYVGADAASVAAANPGPSAMPAHSSEDSDAI